MEGLFDSTPTEDNSSPIGKSTRNYTASHEENLAAALDAEKDGPETKDTASSASASPSPREVAISVSLWHDEEYASFARRFRAVVESWAPLEKKSPSCRVC